MTRPLTFPSMRTFLCAKLLLGSSARHQNDHPLSHYHPGKRALCRKRLAAPQRTCGWTLRERESWSVMHDKLKMDLPTTSVSIVQLIVCLVAPPGRRLFAIRVHLGVSTARPIKRPARRSLSALSASCKAQHVTGRGVILRARTRSTSSRNSARLPT
jgi:hypothetical protein